MDNPTYSAVLLDIEGTTTPVQFVYEILFPFARNRLASFLAECWEDPGVRADVAAFRAQAQSDLAAGLEVPAIPDETAGAAAVRTAIVSSALLQMDGDRKVAALKSLQGRIWDHGYRTGELQGQLFADVPPFLQACQQHGVPVYIYSSGSVLAQKLIFGFSVYGDLTPLLTGYFDTAVGPKREASSYQEIARQIKIEPERGLFATDIAAEAEAAAAAGWQAVVMDRPGNAAQPEHSFPIKTTLG